MSRYTHTLTLSETSKLTSLRPCVLDNVRYDLAPLCEFSTCLDSFMAPPFAVLYCFGECCVPDLPFVGFILIE